MTTKTRIFLATILTVILVVTVGISYYTSALRGYFSSDEVRAEFEGRVGRAIGGRAVVGLITCDLHGFITITDLELDTPPTHDGYPRVIITIPKLQFPWRWEDVLFGRLPIKDVSLFNPTMIITTEPLEGYFDVYGNPAHGLPIPNDPTGTINPDGSYSVRGTSLEWLLKVRKVKVVDGTLILHGPSKTTVAQIKRIYFEADGPPFNGVVLDDLPVTLTNSPLTLGHLHLSFSTDANGIATATDIKAESNLGSLSGTFQDNHLNVHLSGIKYTELAKVLGFYPDLFSNPDSTLLTMDGQWSDLEFAHPKGTGHIDLPESHFQKTPPVLQPFTLIHPPEGKVDPISGRIDFNAFFDMERKTGYFELTQLHCLLGLPQSPTSPATPDRHGKSPTPAPSNLTSLEVTGSGKLDLNAGLFTSLLESHLNSPSVELLLTNATKSSQKIGDDWIFQLFSKPGELQTLQLVSGKPTPPPTATPTPTPSPTPTHRRHH